MKIAVTLLVVVIIAGVLGMAVFGEALSKQFAGVGDALPGTAVRISDVSDSALTESISAPGEIVPHSKVDISAQTMARIVELPFRQGDDVVAGDVVVRLDDRDLKAALESSVARREAENYRLQAEQSRLQSLRTTLELAHRTLERQQSLFDSSDIPRSSLDESIQRVEDLEAQLQAAEHNISQIESGIAAAQADIRRAEEALRNTVIESPISGRVTRLNAEVGEMVVTGTMNNPGTVILTVADLNRMMMEARVAEADIARVKVGQPARIHIIAYPDHVFAGTVSNIALARTGSADGTGYFETEIDIELDGMALRSGLNANVDIDIAEHRGIVVPSQAVVDRLIDDLPDEVLGDESIVDRTKLAARVIFRVIDGKAVATPVTIGASDLTHTMITSGITAGDRIIVGPYKVLAEIKHGDAVRDMDAALDVDGTSGE